VDTLGIDIGGTKIGGAIVDEAGTILHRVFRPTPATDPDRIVEVCLEIVHELTGIADAGALGVAAAAFLDQKREKVYFAPNIAWRDFPLKARMEDVVGMPVRIENDANAAGWAEFRFGAARDARSMMMLTMGTGVGGALIDNGVLMIGGFGSAGELGHIVIEPDGLLCGCGNRGCLEQYASGTALMRIARETVGNPELSSDDLAELLIAGNALAHSALETVCDAMGRGIASLVAVTDPEVVVIGGGVARAGSVLSDLIQSRFLAHYPPAALRPVASIVVATMGNSAGVVGAADLARTQFVTEA
jgi:glucokinase